MGWFTSRSKDESGAPTREDRQKCWETRDAYFACLDRAEVIKAGTEGKACSSERDTYEKNCAKSWVCNKASSNLEVSVDNVFQDRLFQSAESYCRGSKG